MSKIDDIKRSVQNWSGFPVDLDDNSTEEEWQECIDTFEDQLSNEVSDRASSYMSQIRGVLDEKQEAN